MESPLLYSPKTIDCIISRIGFGRYQFLNLFLMGNFWMADGAGLLIIGILTKVLENEWNLPAYQVELVGGIMFVGMIIGVALSGYLGDKIGRRLCLIIFAGVIMASSVSSAFMPEFWSLTIMRCIVGIGLGAIIPICLTLQIEVNTPKSRGIMNVAVGIFYYVGGVYVVLAAMWYIPELNSENWREVLLLSSIPGVFALFFTIILLDESPRFLAIVGKNEQAIKVLEKIAAMNRAEPLSEEEIDLVRKIQAPVDSNSMKNRTKLIFSPKYLATSLKLFFLWLNIGFIYNGLNFILPQTYSVNTDKDMILPNMLISILTGLPSILLSFAIIENAWLGRRNTIRIGLLLRQILLCSLFFIVDQYMFMIIVSACTLVGTTITSMLFPYSSELYETSVRNTSSSICSLMLRIAGFTSPFLMLPLHKLHYLFPYIVFAVSNLISLALAFMLNSKTIGKKLDSDEKSSKENQLIKI